MTKTKKHRAPKYMWLLVDKDGVDCGPYSIREDAEADAWGPRFHEFTIRCYRLVAKKDEPRRRNP